MNPKNKLFTLISVIALALAVSVVGIYSYLSNPKVSADIENDTYRQVGFVSVKKGWNYFNSGDYILSSDSRIISINGNLISLEDARRRNMISKMSLTKDGTIISGDIATVEAKSDFALFFEDISLNPQVYLEGGK
jgi:hypothetical protein